MSPFPSAIRQKAIDALVAIIMAIGGCPPSQEWRDNPTGEKPADMRPPGDPARGLIAASDAWDGRLPELFSGLDHADVGTPVPFPTSCSPQAWAAATPFLLLRTMLGIEPDPMAGLTIDPIPGAIEDDLIFTGVRRLDARFDIRVDDGYPTITPWPEGRLS